MNADQLSDEQIRQMRDWAAECDWRDAEDIPDMSDQEIVRGVERHYEGGVRQFLTDCESTSTQP